jgi:hypothetical protein
VRLSLGREPASTELGSVERDACQPIRVCFCLGALLRSGIASSIRKVLLFIVRDHSPSAAPVRLYHRQRDPPGIFYSSLDPRPGTTALTAPIIGILEILGRYQ